MTATSHIGSGICIDCGQPKKPNAAPRCRSCAMKKKHRDGCFPPAWNRSPDPIDGKKRCTQCKETKALDQFGPNRTGAQGRHPWCRRCRTEDTKARYRADPERYKEAARWLQLKHAYGITKAEYMEMHEQQHGLCAICGRPQRDRQKLRAKIHKTAWLSLDHNHKTGARRKLLCTLCNFGLGCFDDDPELLRAAIAYLEAAA